MCAQRLGRLPEGVRDLLPAEAKYKRNLEKKFAQLVEKWGYQEVITPTFEYAENLIFSSNDEDKLYKFLDRNGHVVAMKPDTTISIARLVASRMRKAPLPLRFYYLSHAFRYEEALAGRQREIYQAGVELLGSKSALADAEVIALAIESAKECDLKDFRVSLGNVEIFHSLMDELDLPKFKVRAIKKAVENKDFVLLNEQLDSKDISNEERERIVQLLSLQGGQEILSEALEILDSQKARLALDNLSKVYGTLQHYGVHNYVTIDLGLLPKLDYYTGVVFELYTLEVGIPISSGGRYDCLTGYFGYELPATGFALSIDRMLEVHQRRMEAVYSTSESRADVLIAWSKDNLIGAIKKANEFREKGVKAELKLEECSFEEAQQYAQEHGIKRVVYVE